MNFVPVKSSTVDSVAFDSATGILGVRFKNGTEYHYFNVPEYIYNGLLSAKSVGKYLDENVKKKGYRHERLK